jgi:hypothetical protein
MSDPKDDQADALLKLADFRFRIRESRRQHEWRVSLGLWVGLGAAIISFKGVVPMSLQVVVLPLIVVGHALLWVRWNWVRGERDSRLVYYYIEKAESLLLKDVPPPQPRPLSPKEIRYGFLMNGPPLFQVLTTVVLALGVVIVAR